MSTVPTDTSTLPTSNSGCMSAPPASEGSPGAMLCYRLEVQPCLDWLYYSTNRVLDDITASDENQLEGMPEPVMLWRLTQDIVGLCEFVLIPNMMPDVPQDWEPDVAARSYLERILQFNMEHLAHCANPDTLRALKFLWDNWTAYLSNGQGEKCDDIENERTNNADIKHERTNSAGIKHERTHSPDIKNEQADHDDIKNELAGNVDIQNELAHQLKNQLANHIKNELTDSVHVKNDRVRSVNIKRERAGSVNIFIKSERADSVDNETHSNNGITIGRDAIRHEGAHSKTRHNTFWTPQELSHVKKIYQEHDGISPRDAAKMFNDHFRGKTINGVKPKKRTMRAIEHKFRDLKVKQTAEHVKQEKREESD